MADDESSELSSVSSLSEPPSEDESDIQLEERQGILKFFHKVDRNPALEPKEKTPPRPKREPSPPHEYVLADNPDIAFIVMFRARFTEAFPKSLANFGPQELERDVVDSVPGERVENFLCALLSLLLNRKQDVKPGHYNRALEEAVQTHKGHWAKDWDSQNPVAGQATFALMTPVQRLTLLRTLVQWTLSSSDAVRTLVAQSYKNRHDEDLNIPLSVQPWGGDGDKRRYFLIEGNDDTSFRVYRESNPAGIQRTWWSVAGSIEDLRALSNKLETVDRGPKAKTFAKRILNSIPRFEATEEKRRRREYRQMRKEQFRRPEPGFSLYEGRTRGKRMKYTYSDDEADFYSDSTNRRSTRNTRHHTPAEPAGPQTTASGRQVRAPARLNAESASNGGKSASASVQGDAGEDAEMKNTAVAAKTATTTRSGRPQRSAAANHGMNGWASKKRKSEEYESEESDSEPDFGDDEEDEHVPDEDDEDEEEFDEEEGMMDEDLDNVSNRSFIFKFPIRVSFDENSRVRQIPGPPVEVERHKHPRSAHRNVVMSDDEETTTDAEPLVVESEPPAAEVIAVATKPVAPLADSQASADATGLVEPTKKLGVDVDLSMTDAGAAEEENAPQTPSSEPRTSLAFRGSPEVTRSAPAAVGVKSTD
ncbi:hypothetical protein C8A05DRAFT_16487 [Staphylotrichum tortipilum]|uniref:WHIM1 domain-containing protein n=1 Tax=Staphylotrichum tortipilum TaxID=2831512 RepID=A0AAN6MJP5_9PEZI|nr:hypothetical protein C8A05DRAFT_16487 [Staphylotrichum longicolle]